MGSSASSSSYNDDDDTTGRNSLAHLDEPIDQIILCHMVLQASGEPQPEAWRLELGQKKAELERLLKQVLNEVKASMKKDDDTDFFEQLLRVTQRRYRQVLLNPNDERVVHEDLIQALAHKRMLSGCFLNVFLALCLFQAAIKSRTVREIPFLLRMHPDGSSDLIRKPRDEDLDDYALPRHELPFRLDVHEYKKYKPWEHGWPYLLLSYVSVLRQRRRPVYQGNKRVLQAIHKQWAADMKPVSASTEPQPVVDSLLGASMPEARSEQDLAARLAEDMGVLEDLPGRLQFG